MSIHFDGEMTVLGDFEMSSPVMRASDPCYDRDVWCCGSFGNCAVGTWEGAALIVDQGDWGKRVAVLAARHKELGPDFTSIRDPKVYLMQNGWVEESFEVGVDSGQAGLFDEAHYQDDAVFDGMPKPEHEYGDRWYNHCCDITLSDLSAGTLPYGVVSSSGYGDGAYVCYTHVGAEGKIDFAFIVFIED